MSLWEEVGGHETFAKLTRIFYEGVANDPEFRAMYPEEDLAPAERRLRMFLEQYFGGPPEYQLERGHPRLRMRHAPFPVDVAARDTWLRHMRAAMDAIALDEAHDHQMWEYFERAATFMINSGEDPAHFGPQT